MTSSNGNIFLWSMGTAQGEESGNQDKNEVAEELWYLVITRWATALLSAHIC